MMSAGDETAGDKSEYRRGRPRHRVDAGEGRSSLAASFPTSFAPHLARPPGFGPLRPWFGACASVVQPFSPVCWMSPGVLAAAGAQCTAGMGVSQVDRLPVSASSGVNSALLRDILARSGVGGGGPPLDLQQSRYSVVEPSPEVQADSSQQPPEEEDEEEKEELDSAPASPAESEKKSRLESIVSGMRPMSSTSPQPINGCKKRKLYQPVQHETLASAGDNESDAEADANDHHAADQHRERDASPADKRRRVDHDETQRAARPLHSQLVLMQQRYAQLYREGERQAGGELDLSRGSAAPSPEKPKDEATRPIPALHKIEAEPAPASSFIDYARRVLAADPRNKENERQPGGPQRPADVQGLADVLKAEITTSLAGLIDQIVAKWAQQRRREPEPSVPYPPAQQQQQERRSPRAEILRRISQHNGRFPAMPAHPFGGGEGMPLGLSPLSSMRGPSSLTPLFPVSRAGSFGNGAPVGYNSAYGLQALRDSMQQHHQQEQDDSPLSLVMTPKKKRHKVTDTRAVPRPIGSRFEDGKLVDDVSSPHGCFGAPPPHLLPPSLPTSVAIPNPSLQESHFFASYPYYGRASSPERRDSASPLAPQTGHQLSLLHPSLLAGGRRSPDSLAYRLDTPDRSAGQRRDTPDRSDCNSLESGFEGQRPVTFPNRIDARSGLSLTGDQASTLTPMHLRKAKLMFFWSRYPSSSILKSFFPDINFNKNNTAQLVKWFSNFREFFYIQMEKYSRQALSEGVKTAEELTVTTDCELLRVLNLHYNRNNHIEVPTNFPFVAEAALREFFRALQAARDAEPSWKKAIYKVIARLDENVPEYFRLPSFLEQLE